MAYSLFWRSPALPYTQKQLAITVPAGSVISNAASIRFTGKGATNYGKIQQENQMRLLENFAAAVEPEYPTVGQTWYDTANAVLKVCTATPPLSIAATADWRSLNATYVTDPGDPPPANPVLGDVWFERTSDASGIMYAFTGVGRYPHLDWDAHDELWGALATTNLAIRINAQSFAGAIGSQYGEAYIHGYTGVTPADVPGSVTTSSGTLAVPQGALQTRYANPAGYIVYDTSGTLDSGSNPGTIHFFQVRKVSADNWEYDNNLVWVPFTPTGNMWVIGAIQVSEDDDNTAPGIGYAEVWTQGFTMTTGRTRALPPLTKTATDNDGGIGGWAQIWPTIETSAGREEYNTMHEMVMQLIGSVATFGGSDALGKAVTNLTDFETIDASYLANVYDVYGNDVHISATNNSTQLFMDANSNDWDHLLAAAKYAMSRLELPASYATDVSPIPFVYDGRPAPADLLALSTSDVRYPSVSRRHIRRFGSVTMNSFYTETVNVLNAAIQNRYLMKGILGNSGTNTTFPSTVSLTSQQKFTLPSTSLPTSGTITHGLSYVIDQPGGLVTADKLKTFFTSAQAIDVVIKHTPGGSPTAADTNLVALLATQGRVRVTFDQTFVMTPNLPTSLSLAPVNAGYANATTAGVILTTLSGTNVSITVRALLSASNDGLFALELDVNNTNGAFASGGTFEVDWSYVNDAETYNNPGPVRVYPGPGVYSGTHKRGAAAFSAIGT